MNRQYVRDRKFAHVFDQCRFYYLAEFTTWRYALFAESLMNANRAAKRRRGLRLKTSALLAFDRIRLRDEWPLISYNFLSNESCIAQGEKP